METGPAELASPPQVYLEVPTEEEIEEGEISNATITLKRSREEIESTRNRYNHTKSLLLLGLLACQGVLSLLAR